MWFAGWEPLVRTLVTGACAYAALVLLVRVAGKRTLSKMNAFDLVVTVALGSTLASTLTSQDVTIAQGILALTLLIGLQFVITWLSVRSARVREITRSEPTLIAYGGRPLDDALRRERMTHGELEAAVRDAGVGALDDVAAVVLETDGTVSVVRHGAIRADAERSIIPGR
jgi:uncharacterized membrane protein YcaP (DUF421 family)